MDKVTIAKLVWGLMMIACCLGFWSIAKALSSGEIKRGRAGVATRTLRQEQNPESFWRYVVGVTIINVFFFFAMIIWGIALFLWY